MQAPNAHDIPGAQVLFPSGHVFCPSAQGTLQKPLYWYCVQPMPAAAEASAMPDVPNSVQKAAAPQDLVSLTTFATASAGVFPAP